MDTLCKMDTFLTSNHNNDCILKWRWLTLLFSGHWRVLSGLLFTIAVGVTMFHKISVSLTVIASTYLAFETALNKGSFLNWPLCAQQLNYNYWMCWKPWVRNICCKGKMVGSQFCPVWSGSTVVKSYLGKLRQPTFLSENIVDITYNVGQHHIMLFLNMIIYTIRKHSLCK